MITIADKLIELKREQHMRKGVYSHWVRSGKMKQDTADHRLAVLQAIIDDYESAIAPKLAV